MKRKSSQENLGDLITISQSEKTFRTVMWGVLITICLFPLFGNMKDGDVLKSLMCVISVGLVSLPFIASKIFRFEMNSYFYVFAELYALSVFLGEVYNLYEHISNWDEILHTCGGFVFAVFGAYLYERTHKEHGNVLMCAIFALCFSVTLSALWEFAEYGFDTLFGLDMQRDTVINEINSYLFGESIGEVGSTGEINEIIINGVPLEINGYIDIGLHDTMSDMLVETLGAVVFVVFYLIDNGKHKLLYPVDTYEKEACFELKANGGEMVLNQTNE